jgi:hypothetical protein
MHSTTAASMLHRLCASLFTVNWQRACSMYATIDRPTTSVATTIALTSDTTGTGAVCAVQLSGVPQLIEKVRWDMKEIGMEHNQYVDIISKEMQSMMRKIQHVKKKTVVPLEICRLMAEHNIHGAMLQLVEGYSRVKKVCERVSCV